MQCQKNKSYETIKANETKTKYRFHFGLEWENIKVCLSEITVKEPLLKDFRPTDF